MDRVAEIYQGRAGVATVDVSDPAGAELGQRYGAGAKSMAIAFFTRDGTLAEQAPTITEEQAKMTLDRLLGGK